MNAELPGWWTTGCVRDWLANQNSRPNPAIEPAMVRAYRSGHAGFYSWLENIKRYGP
jgi:hypothetical protein